MLLFTARRRGQTAALSGDPQITCRGHWLKEQWKGQMRGERGRKGERRGGTEERTERGTEKRKYSLSCSHTHTHRVFKIRPTVGTITSSARSHCACEQQCYEKLCL